MSLRIVDVNMYKPREMDQHILQHLLPSHAQVHHLCVSITCKGITTLLNEELSRRMKDLPHNGDQPPLEDGMNVQLAD